MTPESERAQLAITTGPSPQRHVRLPNSRSGISVPSQIHARATLPVGAGQLVDVEIDLRLSEQAQRYKLLELRVASPPAGAEVDADDAGHSEQELDANVLRAIRVGQLIAQVVAMSSHLLTWDDDSQGPTHRLFRKDLNPNEDVAFLWLLARLSGQQSNVLIADQLGITPAAAAQRVSRARRLGLIPPAAKPGARR